MLNKLGPSVEIGESNLKYGDVLFQNDAENFESLFNKFVGKCIEKNIMKRTLSSDCTKQLEWAQELSDIERAIEAIEVVKELVRNE